MTVLANKNVVMTTIINKHLLRRIHEEVKTFFIQLQINKYADMDFSNTQKAVSNDWACKIKKIDTIICYVRYAGRGQKL